MRSKQRSTRARGTLAGGVALLVAGCQFPVPEDKSPPADAARVCEPASHVCAGGVATHCSDDGTSSTTETCTFGCAATNDRCADLDPSNGLAAQLDEARTADPLVLTGDAVIDTTAGTIMNGDGTRILVRSTTISGGPVEILALSVGSLQVQNVSVRGSRALAVLSHGDVTIAGHLSASARNGEPGSGSIVDAQATCSGQRGGSDPDGRNFSGGGGGGHGTAGGIGGRGGSLPFGLGGMTTGQPDLRPLHGGCAGATASSFGRGGGGGGAVQLSSRGTVRIEPGGFISANGGGADGGLIDPLTCPFLLGLSCFAGSGGGAGGAILVEAAGLALGAGSGLVANGGSGHMGTSPPSAASDGLLSESPSPAFVPCLTGTCPRGGNGGARTTLPGGGEPVASGEGAGGGGGVGRIRINLPAGASPAYVSPILSPAPSVANVTTR